MLNEISKCGEEIKTRLVRVSQIGRTLLNAGWDGCGLLYDLDFLKEVTLEEAKAELKALGINESEITLDEEDLEDEDDR